MWIIFAFSVTSLKSGFCVGKETPTGTSWFLPFQEITAAFGGDGLNATVLPFFFGDFFDLVDFLAVVFLAVVFLGTPCVGEPPDSDWEPDVLTGLDPLDVPDLPAGGVDVPEEVVP
jgi:hypothetical protein